MSWSSSRLLAAAIAGSGVFAGLLVNIARAIRLNESLGLVLTNYFSLFTIVSAIATIAVLLVAVRRSASDPLAVESNPLAIALATTSAAVIILGIVFNALLRGAPPVMATPDPPLVAFLDRWATETLHVVLPIFLVADVVFGPRRRRLSWKTLPAIVGIPLLWAVYTMVRGPLVHAPDGTTPYWYPYGFLNPNGPTGYGMPLEYIGAIAAGFVVVGSILILLTHRRHRTPRQAAARAMRLRAHLHA